MFGIGSTELLVILVVALIALGPKSLASVSRSLGKAMGEFRRVSSDFQRTLNAEAAEEEMREVKRKREAEKEQAARRAKAQNENSSGQYENKDGATTVQNNDRAGKESFDSQMSRIGKWEKPNPDCVPPPGSPLAEAIEKAAAEARGQLTGPKDDAAPQKQNNCG